jgi:hypothetical protein
MNFMSYLKTSVFITIALLVGCGGSSESKGNSSNQEYSAADSSGYYGIYIYESSINNTEFNLGFLSSPLGFIQLELDLGNDSYSLLLDNPKHNQNELSGTFRLFKDGNNFEYIDVSLQIDELLRHETSYELVPLKLTIPELNVDLGGVMLASAAAENESSYIDINEWQAATTYASNGVDSITIQGNKVYLNVAGCQYVGSLASMSYLSPNISSPMMKNVSFSLQSSTCGDIQSSFAGVLIRTDFYQIRNYTTHFSTEVGTLTQSFRNDF